MPILRIAAPVHHIAELRLPRLDTYFCRHCLREKLIPRYLTGNSTAGPPVDGSTPRGIDSRQIVEVKKEEPTPIEHPKEHGDLWRGESWGWFPKLN